MTTEATSTTPTAAVVAAGLLGGYTVARYSGHRSLGGVALAAAAAHCTRSWLRSSGPGVTTTLLGAYVAAFGLSHPLARTLGPWGSVLTVTAAASGVTYVLADRSGVTT